MRKNRLVSKSNRFRRGAVWMLITTLLGVLVIAAPALVAAEEPGFAVFVNSDFTQTEGVAGFFFASGSTVTMDIDYEKDGSFDFTATSGLDPDGAVQFFASELGFAVAVGDLVRLSDDQNPQNVKEHTVEYMTLTDVDAAADTVAGTANEGTVLSVRAADPAQPVPWDGPDIEVIVGPSGNWSVDFSPFEIGKEGWVLINDDDGDHTQINWVVDVYNINSFKGFDTIQAAIDDPGTENGHTIEVRDGTYHENVIVNKELTIRPMEYSHPIVDGGGSGACFGIYRSGGLSDVTIDGFEIQNADRGIWIYGDPTPTVYNNITISNNHVHDQVYNGILVTDATVNGLTISGNLVSVGCSSPGWQIGISFANNSTVTGLNIDRNDIRQNCAGLSLLGGEFNDVSVTNSVFDGNEWEHINLGVTWTEPAIISNVQISNCQFYTYNNWCDIYVAATFKEMLGTDYNVRINYNEFFSAPPNYGVFNNTTVVINGIANWWGDLSGPYNPLDTDGLDQVNPDGLGDIVTEYVLYDPWIGQGGFVTGGGTIWSDQDNYAWDPEAEGVANFGFISKYKKGAKVPEGNTNFVFSAGDLHFQSSEYDWLVVAGDKAHYKGLGAIQNSEGPYKFMLWAEDGEPDTFRIRIWEEDEFGVETDVYDCGTETLTGGNIFIHKQKVKK